MPGRSIRIFLVDGTASGLRTAELGLSTIKAVVIPRASLSEVTRRAEVQKTGVYILVGADPDKPGVKKIYIGEGDAIFSRLTSHNREAAKDFWDEAILFVSKDENLTKAHVRYVEARLIGLARHAKRSTVTNGTEPSGQGRLPEGDEVEMEEYITQARLLLGTLGYDFFEPFLSPYDPALLTPTGAGRKLPEFVYEGDGFSAICIVDLDAGQFVVKAGSRARKTEALSLRQTYRNLRSQLLGSGVLADNSYLFTQDYSFSAVTAAAQVVSGQSVNGRTVWRTATDGKTFAEWQDAQIEGQSAFVPPE
jgi:hypothetical protein